MASWPFRARSGLPSAAPCRKECLTYTTSMQRPDTEDRQQTRHVGNTVFSRYTDEMLKVVMEVTASGGIERLIVPGAPL
ncbi:MAG: hypothetical protein U5L98_18335 [Halomonas sp.]|uniref:hypothetical protein n=1 Tax=Halomonas sp. TaxID=1486246 RepID=UPI002ACEF7B0|nr:hypothetical protein [Halomonas sp.]MDZ7854531.1 hypothetical protein [Halomonas sp.]